MASIIYKRKTIIGSATYNYLVGEPGLYIPPPPITTWSPSELTTTFWFDAAVDTSVIRDGNGVITQWLDISGNANNTNQTLGSPNEYFFRESIKFDGVDDYFRVPVVDTTDRSIFLVANKANTNYAPLTGAATSGTNLSPQWVANGFYAAYRCPSTNSIYENAVGGSFDDFAIGGFIFNSPTTIIISHNGTPVTLTKTSGTWTNIDKRIDTIGRDYTGTQQYFDGSIKEIIVFPTILSESDRQKVEGYLAWKWGLNDKLSASHPYLGAPPPAP